MRERYALSCLGMVNALGSNPGEILQRALMPDIGRLKRVHGYRTDGEALVAAVREELPGVPDRLAGYDCRNNRLLHAAFLQIRENVREAAERYGPARVGVVLGTSTSGIAATEEAYARWHETGNLPRTYDYRRMHEMVSPSEFVAALAGASGPACTHSTACSTSTRIFASARYLIQSGLCDAVIVGGADSLCRLTVAGFASLEAISDNPSVPMSLNRCGFNVGEGAALFLLEQGDGPVHLLGVGESTDAHHISAPDPEGRGARAAIIAALQDSGLDPRSIDYVNLHGTGTRLNDAIESAVVFDLFGDAPCSSSKPLIGHALGAAGALEAGLCWLSMTGDSGGVPLLPHHWDGETDPALAPLRLVRPGDRLPAGKRPIMLSNSFAFGGNNGAVVLG